MAAIPGMVVAASFPAPYNSEQDTSTAPLPPAEAAEALKLPAGFRAQLFAAEPSINNPIALAWDPRGRLWVAENYTYAEYTVKFDLKLHDRIVVFEDAQGRAENRKVFIEGLQRLTGVEIGQGGVWAMCPPQLLFIPDRNGDAVPDGPAEVVLDGFDVPTESHHTVANGVKFGPDGWLYGRVGSSSPGEVGAPGTDKSARVPIRGSIWRFHPRRRIFESLSGGTTNPWGHDWDRHGELFFINTVNGHLWHGITGAHFQRTPYPNPQVYALIDHHADHWHFDTGQGWKSSRDGAANLLGGGHAHVGMMIYQADNFPAEYRHRLFTLNFHGRRANQERLERAGSGYVGRHGPDLFVSADKWFRGQEIAYGPDGGVFVLDWSDTGECHEATGVHRTSGRIFKITYGEAARPSMVDVARLEPGALARLHTHANEWFVRQARLELAARAAAGRDVGEALRLLRELFAAQTDAVLRLRALWTLYAMGGTDAGFLRGLLRDGDEHVRTWAIRLLTDAWPLDTVMSRRPARPEARPEPALLAEFAAMARTDSSGLVRLALASALQRIAPQARVTLAQALGGRTEDAEDHNLPLLVWYGLIPVADVAAEKLPEIAAACEWPLTRQLIARRLAQDLEKNPAALGALVEIAAAKHARFQVDVITGMAGGLNGWRKAAKPVGWEALAKGLSAAAPAVRQKVRELEILFGDGRALDEVRSVALDPRADLTAREAALQALIANRPADLREVCERLLTVRGLNAVAVRGLTQFDDPAVGEKIAASYRTFFPSDRDVVVAALVARPNFARALLAEIAAGRIPRAALSAYHARQIRGYGDAALARQLAAVWGEAREPAADKRALIDRLKVEITADKLARADKGRGRAMFATLCGSCHTLYGEGGRLGPDLTGSGRASLDYLLENIADPNATVAADFRLNVITLRDGRSLSGFISGQTPRTLTLTTLTDSITFERAEVQAQQEMPQSLMPEGLLESVSGEERINLLAYLMRPSQVALPDPP